MGGVKKIPKKVGSTIGDLVDKSFHPKSTLKSWGKSLMDPLLPEKPKMGESPLMPDLELIEQSRRRKRQQKMGRTETIMTSDTLG